MPKITLLPARYQAGRICQVTMDTFVESRQGELTLPQGALVVLLPAPRLRPTDLEHRPIMVYVCPKEEQPVDFTNLYRETVSLSLERIRPTEEVFTHVKDLDWVAHNVIFENFNLSETYISNLCDVHGDIEAFSKLRYFSRFYRSWIQIPCKSCGKIISAYTYQDNKRQTVECRWCGSCFDLPPANEREKLITKQICGEINENTNRSQE